MWHSGNPVADWERPVSEIKLGQKIGQGAVGDVLRGTWQGTDVAVKCLQNVTDFNQASEDFRHEVAIIMKLRHPNIILFMGACIVPPDVCIVMEYAANGSLYSVLHNPKVTIGMPTVVRWAIEAAQGMNYLHTRRSGDHIGRLKKGLLDGLISKASKVDGNLPKPNMNIQELTTIFANKDLHQTDMADIPQNNLVDICSAVGIFSKFLVSPKVAILFHASDYYYYWTRL